MKPIRTAAIGVGVQGDRHAQKLAALPNSELVAVVDADASRAAAVADKLGTEAVPDYRDLVGKIDAVALSTPTSTHFEIARELLQHGVHLLVEKPITTTVDEARELVRLADENSLILQVGHLERFNPVVTVLAEHVTDPQFIELNRIAPYKPRALDVSVILDLMIHDIDLIHSFARSPMQKVDALGRSVFSDSIDIANARIEFDNGAVVAKCTVDGGRTITLPATWNKLSGSLDATMNDGSTSVSSVTFGANPDACFLIRDAA